MSVSYKKINIIIDLITFKLKVSTLRKVLKVKKVVDKIEKNKFELDNIVDIKIKDIKETLKFHNRYTKGKKIDFKLFEQLYDNYCIMIYNKIKDIPFRSYKMKTFKKFLELKVEKINKKTNT